MQQVYFHHRDIREEWGLPSLGSDMDVPIFIPEIERLIGQMVTFVRLGQWSIGIKTTDAWLFVECHWVLHEASGVTIDRFLDDQQKRLDFYLWKIIGANITSARIDRSGNDKLTIVFSNDMVLRIYGNDDAYEDWALWDNCGVGPTICMGTVNY